MKQKMKKNTTATARQPESRSQMIFALASSSILGGSEAGIIGCMYPLYTFWNTKQLANSKRKISFGEQMAGRTGSSSGRSTNCAVLSTIMARQIFQLDRSPQQSSIMRTTIKSSRVRANGPLQKQLDTAILESSFLGTIPNDVSDFGLADLIFAENKLIFFTPKSNHKIKKPFKNTVNLPLQLPPYRAVEMNSPQEPNKIKKYPKQALNTKTLNQSQISRRHTKNTPLKENNKPKEKSEEFTKQKKEVAECLATDPATPNISVRRISNQNGKAGQPQLRSCMKLISAKSFVDSFKAESDKNQCHSIQRLRNNKSSCKTLRFKDRKCYAKSNKSIRFEDQENSASSQNEGLDRHPEKVKKTATVRSILNGSESQRSEKSLMRKPQIVMTRSMKNIVAVKLKGSKKIGFRFPQKHRILPYKFDESYGDGFVDESFSLESQFKDEPEISIVHQESQREIFPSILQLPLFNVSCSTNMRYSNQSLVNLLNYLLLSSPSTISRCITKVQSGFAVTLFVNGNYELIRVDDRFPRSAGEPLFGKVCSGFLWFDLIVKCLAKVYGGYAQVSQLSFEQVFTTLTGKSLKRYSLDQRQIFTADVESFKEFYLNLWRKQHRIGVHFQGRYYDLVLTGDLQLKKEERRSREKPVRKEGKKRVLSQKQLQLKLKVELHQLLMKLNKEVTWVKLRGVEDSCRVVKLKEFILEQFQLFSIPQKNQQVYLVRQEKLYLCCSQTTQCYLWGSTPNYLSKCILRKVDERKQITVLAESLSANTPPQVLIRLAKGQYELVLNSNVFEGENEGTVTILTSKTVEIYSGEDND